MELRYCVAEPSLCSVVVALCAFFCVQSEIYNIFFKSVNQGKDKVCAQKYELNGLAF